MGAYDHAYKAMRQQMDAARARRERNKSMRSTEWEALHGRTPVGATCVQCGISEAERSLVTSAEGLRCLVCDGEAELALEQRRSLGLSVGSSVAWTVATLAALIPPAIAVVRAAAAPEPAAWGAGTLLCLILAAGLGAWTATHGVGVLASWRRVHASADGLDGWVQARGFAGGVAAWVGLIGVAGPTVVLLD